MISAKELRESIDERESDLKFDFFFMAKNFMFLKKLNRKVKKASALGRYELELSFAECKTLYKRKKLIRYLYIGLGYGIEKQSGAVFSSLINGAYSEISPLIINWYPKKHHQL